MDIMDMLIGFVFGYFFCIYVKKDIDQIIQNFRKVSKNPSQIATEQMMAEFKKQMEELKKLKSE